MERGTCLIAFRQTGEGVWTIAVNVDGGAIDASYTVNVVGSSPLSAVDFIL
jgi:hypothetical protein